MHKLELRIPPVALMIIVAACMWATSSVLPALHVELPGAAPIVAGLALLGVSISLMGVMAFRSAGTTVDPRNPDQSATLVVRGIYRFSRNPMYVGFFLVMCAWGMLLSNLVCIVFLPAFVMYMNRFQIAPEEKHMREKFGEAFNRYTKQVRRWF
ncbi:MAG: methyltransferase family protein [Oceanococcus sp.]